jgi:hypothetical protein
MIASPKQDWDLRAVARARRGCQRKLWVAVVSAANSGDYQGRFSFVHSRGCSRRCSRLVNILASASEVVGVLNFADLKGGD